MSTASERTIDALEQVVKDAPVGTNLALLHLLWAMLSGAFLRSRGAVFSALQLAGFTAAQIRRCGQALRCGAWSIADLVQAWRSCVLSQGQWRPNSYEGYSPVAVDLTAFWRPRLKGRVGKFFHHIANRALKGIGFGLVVQVGRVGDQRIPLLRHILRAQKAEMSESQLKRQVLEAAAHSLGKHEVLVHDAGASIADMQEANVPRYVVRMALNCTARRNELPPRKSFDPLYRDPLVLGTSLVAQPQTILCLYLDRWPVEQVPLVAKQLLGLERQFVFAPTSRQRLPELALLAANILTYLAAVLPPLPTGFWDRRPQRTPGRLRRVLAQSGFPEDYPLDERIREKASVTAHLPKGIEAHRRRKAA